MPELTQEQINRLRDELIAIPLMFDQYGLNARSLEIVPGVVPGVSVEQAQAIIEHLRETGVIAPELVPRGGEDHTVPARVRWVATRI